MVFVIRSKNGPNAKGACVSFKVWAKQGPAVSSALCECVACDCVLTDLDELITLSSQWYVGQMMW